MNDEDFSLTIRQIERFFNRQSKNARDMGIPKGISTLGYSGCPHWTVSQYIFGYPVINEHFIKDLKYELIMDNDLSFNSYQITETHPALALWIVLKDILKDHKLMKDSWQYKGYSPSDQNISKRFELIVKTLLDTDFVTSTNIKTTVDIDSDDKLDAFVCYLLGFHFIHKTNQAKILGDKVNGSFLIAYEKSIFDKFHLKYYGNSLILD